MSSLSDQTVNAERRERSLAAFFVSANGDATSVALIFDERFSVGKRVKGFDRECRVSGSHPEANTRKLSRSQVNNAAGLTSFGRRERGRFELLPRRPVAVPSDTTTEAEQVQLRLQREKSPSERVGMALRHSGEVVRLAKRAIQRVNPAA